MKHVLKKIQRVQPLIRAKKVALDTESAALAAIRDQKLKAIQQLKDHQQQYILGVERINDERQAGNLAQMMVLEPAIESAKLKWHETLKRVSEIEGHEKNQLNRVLEIQTSLKSFEKLEEQYVMLKSELEIKADQKNEDEIATIKRATK